ncbi:MAG: thiamine phosphate synthase [Pyrinomonadaceae bacterium]
MKFRLPKIYPITDTRISGLSHLEQVKRLVSGGACLIQLREKNASSREFFEAARDVVAFARDKNLKIIINDRVDIAIAAKADGVHLGQDDLNPVEARKLLGETAIIGYSTHTVEQALLAADMPIDYAAFGPIFETGSKKDHDPIVGIAGLKTIRSSIGNLPLVAIGGITSETLDGVLKSGADSAAMIGSILSDPENIADEFRKLSTIGQH